MTRTPIMRGRVLADASGFTLIELLVAMVTALLVTFAALALLEFSTGLFQQVNDRIDSATSGRAAMVPITQDLAESCVFPGTSPVQSSAALPSGGSSLVFWSSPGGQATTTPVLHSIKFTGSAITDARYALTSGTTPTTWSLSSTAEKTATLAANISEVSGTPVFQYFGYNSATGAISTTNLAGSGNLTTAQAATVLAVGITFSAGPYQKSTQSTQATRQTLEKRNVVLRLSPLGSTASNVACS
jgi:Tfp pilus assembly protein PilW